MKYEGAIDYLDVPLGEVDWGSPRDSVISPWKSYTWGQWHTTDGDGGGGPSSVILRADARKFKWNEKIPEEYENFYDSDERIAAAQASDLKCVVLGSKRAGDDAPMEQTIHYVLIIAPKRLSTSNESLSTEHQRVGVGLMAGRYIDWSRSKFVDIE